MTHHHTSGRGGLPILIANCFSPFSFPLHLVRRQYRRHGFESHVVPFRSADMCDVDAFATHIAQSIEEYCGENRLAKVNLMGISLGGVASLVAIKRHGIADRVATFAAIGAPIRGVSWSWIGTATGICPRLAMQLSRDSAYVRELESLPMPVGPRYVSVSGTKDLICPPWTSEIREGEDILLPIGHVDTVGNPRIAAAVAPYLGRFPLHI